MILLGTCGRGLENFAKEELEEIKSVCCTNIIAEGKILFCVCNLILQSKNVNCAKTVQLVSDMGSTKNIRNCLSNNMPLDSFYQEKFLLSHEILSKLTFLLELKMMERVFVVLYYEAIKSIIQTEIGSKEVMKAISKIHFNSVMDSVSHLRTSVAHERPPWRGCASPATCFAFIMRQKERSLHVSRKRKYEDSNAQLSGLHSLSSKSNLEPEKVMRPVSSSSADSDTTETKDKLKTKTFLVSCRIRGKWKKFLRPLSFTKLIASVILMHNETWNQVTENPDVNLYFNLNDECIIVGASLTDKPLSLRSYIPHITLRSTICHLMIRQAKITSGLTILDPMAGAGTILLEAAVNIKNLTIIVNEIDLKQLSAARCNMRDFNNVEFILSDAANLPLRENSIDAVVCDFPFGKKHSVTSYEELLPRVLKGCIRVLRSNARLVILVSAQQQLFLKDFSSENKDLQILGIHPVSLGLTPAFVFTFQIK